jgi:hypothetical protein
MEKINGSYDLSIVKKKLNQVVEYLNSESQPEGNYKLTIEELKDIIKTAKKGKNDAVSIEYLMQHCGYHNSQGQELDKAREEGRKDALEEIKESMESYLEEDTTTYEVVEMLLDELKIKAIRKSRICEDSIIGEVKSEKD